MSERARRVVGAHACKRFRAWNVRGTRLTTERLASFHWATVGNGISAWSGHRSRWVGGANCHVHTVLELVHLSWAGALGPGVRHVEEPVVLWGTGVVDLGYKQIDCAPVSVLMHESLATVWE